MVIAGKYGCDRRVGVKTVGHDVVISKKSM